MRNILTVIFALVTAILLSTAIGCFWDNSPKAAMSEPKNEISLKKDKLKELVKDYESADDDSTKAAIRVKIRENISGIPNESLPANVREIVR